MREQLTVLSPLQSDADKKGRMSNDRSLVDEIANLRSRLRELEEDDPRSPRSTGGTQQRIPAPSQDSDETINQLRLRLNQVEQEKSSMELVFMNQISSLAQENQTTIDGLQTKLTRSEKTIAMLSSPNKAGQNDEIAKLRRLLVDLRDAHNDELGKVAAEASDSRKEVKKYKRELEDMQEQMHGLQASKDELNAEFRHVMEEKDEGDATIAALRKSLKNLEQTNKTQMAELQQGFKEKMAKTEQANRSRVIKLEEELDKQALIDRDALDGANNAFQHRLEKMHEKAAKDEATIEALKTSLVAEQSTKSDASSKVQELQRRLEEESEAFKAQISKLEAAREMENAERSSLRASLLQEKEAVSALKKDLDEQTTKTRIASDQTESLRLQIIALKQELADEETTNNDLRSSLEEARNNMRLNSTREKDALHNQIRHLREQLAHEQSVSTKLKASLDAHENNAQEDVPSQELESLKLELQTVVNSNNADITLLKKELRAAQAEAEGKTEALYHMEAEMSDERRLRKSLTTQLTQLKASKQQDTMFTNRDFSRVSQAAGSNTAELDSLRKQNKHLSEELKSRSQGNDDQQHDELERLRLENVKLREDLKFRTPSQDVEKLKKQVEELKAAKKQLEEDNLKRHLNQSFDKSKGKPLPKAGVGQSGHSTPQRSTETISYLSTPPMSPPLNYKKPSSSGVPTPRTPVRGIVQSFERRISRNNSFSSIASNTVESSELEELRQEVAKEKRHVVELREQLEQETNLVAELRSQVGTMEKGKRVEEASLAANLKNSQQQIQSLQVKIEDMQQSHSSTLEDNAAKIRELDQEITTKSQKISDLDADLSKYKTALQIREEDFQKLQDEKRQEITELEKKLLELTEFRQNADGLIEELESLRNDLEDADVAYKELEDKNMEQQEEIEMIRAALVAAQANATSLTDGEIKTLQVRLEGSTVEIDRLAGVVSQFELCQKELQEQSRVERARIEELERELESGVAAVNKLERERQELQRQVGSLKADLVASNDALEINLQQMKQLEDNHEGGEEELVKLRQKIASDREGNRCKEEEVGRLREQVNALQKELIGSLSEAETLKEVISNLKNAHETELEDTKDNHKKSFYNEMNSLKAELTNTQMAKANVEMEYMSKIHQLENELEYQQAEMVEEIDEKAKQITELKINLTRKEDEVAQLQKEREQICSTMNSMSSSRRDEFEELQSEVMELTAKAASQTRETQLLKMKLEEHEHRKNDSEALKTKIKELETELRRRPNPRETSVGDLERIKMENVDLRESIRSVMAERRMLQERVDSYKHHDKNASKNSQALREKNAVMKKEIELLKKQVKKMEAGITRFAI